MRRTSPSSDLHRQGPGRAPHAARRSRARGPRADGRVDPCRRRRTGNPGADLHHPGSQWTYGSPHRQREGSLRGRDDRTSRRDPARLDAARRLRPVACATPAYRAAHSRGCRSSCSPRAPPRTTRLPASTAASTTTSPSPSRRASSRHAFRPCLRRRLPQLSKEAVEIEGLVLNPATRVVSGKSRTLKMGPHGIRAPALLHDPHGPRVHSCADP